MILGNWEAKIRKYDILGEYYNRTVVNGQRKFITEGYATNGSAII
jgi:hypothetical protein